MSLLVSLSLSSPLSSSVDTCGAGVKVICMYFCSTFVYVVDFEAGCHTQGGFARVTLIGRVSSISFSLLCWVLPLERFSFGLFANNAASGHVALLSFTNNLIQKVLSLQAQNSHFSGWVFQQLFTWSRLAPCRGQLTTVESLDNFLVECPWKHGISLNHSL